MTKDKTVTMSREQFQAAIPVPYGVFWSEPDSRYMTSMAHLNCLEYQGKWLGWQSAILATPVVERQEPVGEVADMKYNRVQFYRATGDTSKPYLAPGTKLYTAPPAPVAVDIEAAAQKLASCMDYPWEHMPEQGRNSMREHAKAILSAASLDKVKELNQ